MQHAIVFRVITCTSLTVLTRNKVTAQLQVVSSGQKVFSSLGVPLVILVLTTFMRNFIAILKRVAVFVVWTVSKRPAVLVMTQFLFFPEATGYSETGTFIRCSRIHTDAHKPAGLTDIRAKCHILRLQVEQLSIFRCCIQWSGHDIWNVNIALKYMLWWLSWKVWIFSVPVGAAQVVTKRHKKWLISYVYIKQ